MTSPTKVERAWLAALILVGGMLVGSSWSDAVQEGLGGALIAVACTGEGATPAGAELHRLLGTVACMAPWATAAGRIACLSGVCAVVCMLLVFGLVRRCTGNHWAASVAALTLITGDIFWRTASQASLLPLALALCLAGLYCAVRGMRASPGWALVGGVCAGLAAGTHPAAAVAAPFCLLAAARPLTSPLSLAARMLLVVAGVSAGLFFSGGLAPLPGGASVEPLSRLGELVMALPAQLGGVLWPLSLLGLGVLCFHAAGRPLGRPLRGRLPRDLAGLLAALPLLAGPGLVLLAALKDPLDPARLARPHFILASGLLCVPLGIGLSLLDSSLIRKASAPPATQRRRATFWHALALVVLGAYALVAYPRARMDNDFLVEDFTRNSLNSAERGSTLLISGVTYRSTFRYAQQVLRLRPDVMVMDPALRDGDKDPLRLIQNELRKGRPVQITADQNEARRVRNAFGAYAAGPLLRIQPPDRRPPSTQTVADLNRRLFRGFSRRGKIPYKPDPLRATELLEPYARAWRALGRALFRQGKSREAFRTLVQAQRWAPWLEAPAWYGIRKGRPTL